MSSQAAAGGQVPATVGVPGGSAGSASVVPSEAPALFWVAVFTAVVLWWIWPWLARLRGDPTSPALSAKSEQIGGKRLPHAPLTTAAELQAASAAAAAGEEHGHHDVDAIAEAGAGRLAADLSFDLLDEFKATFAASSKHLGEVLVGPPAGEAYTAAITALKKFVDILDRMFLAFGSNEDMAKFSGLREASGSFKRDFGPHRLGQAMRGMLEAAGFERREVEADDGGAGAVWSFPYEDALARLKGLTVRLCLQKSADLQKLRGAGRFLHTNNDAVVPKLDDACFAELVDLYRGRALHNAAQSELRPSIRERNLEADVRIKMNQRRADQGLELLTLHEGLASIARTLADAQRTRTRKDADDLYPRRRIGAEVRAAMAKLPLPPGFTVAHLHWSSTELPRLFGLASTRGGATGKDPDAGDGDTAADIMANEAVGFWAVRQQKDVFWPAATICGVGAALDYTVNKGFAVALLVGFEASEAEDASGELLAGASEGLRRRPKAATDAASARPKVTEPVKFTPSGSHKPRITGFRDLGASKPKGGG